MLKTEAEQKHQAAKNEYICKQLYDDLYVKKNLNSDTSKTSKNSNEEEYDYKPLTYKIKAIFNIP